jgi:hypothetical protein
VTVVRQLRAESAGEIVVLSGASLIRALLEAGEVDRLVVNVCPEISGGGSLLSADAWPATFWRLTHMMPSDSGAIILTYDKSCDIRCTATRLGLEYPRPVGLHPEALSFPGCALSRDPRISAAVESFAAT